MKASISFYLFAQNCSYCSYSFQDSASILLPNSISVVKCRRHPFQHFLRISIFHCSFPLNTNGTQYKLASPPPIIYRIIKYIQKQDICRWALSKLWDLCSWLHSGWYLTFIFCWDWNLINSHFKSEESKAISTKWTWEGGGPNLHSCLS